MYLMRTSSKLGSLALFVTKFKCKQDSDSVGFNKCGSISTWDRIFGAINSCQSDFLSNIISKLFTGNTDSFLASLTRGNCETIQLTCYIPGGNSVQTRLRCSLLNCIYTLQVLQQVATND